MLDLELKIPEEVLESIPSGKAEMLQYLSGYFDGVIEKYDSRFQQRVSGPMGGPLSRYERSILKDFLMDITLGRIQEAQAREHITIQ